MIASLEGIVADKLGELVVIEVNGVGYGLYATAEDMGALDLGATARFYIYEHIRENTHDLYGFKDQTTKQMFEKLLNVNGVGPRMALNMLSIGTTEALIEAIIGGDTKFIQSASGVGKRVAERVVVDLKDKLGAEGVDLSHTGLLQSDETLLKDEALAALVSLGYSSQDAAHALRGVDDTLPTAERIKLALKDKK